MTIKPDLDRLEHRQAVRGSGIDAQARGLTGQVAVGRYVLQFGEPHGAVLREASRPERAHIRPRPTPILLQPRLMRGLLDRRTELACALSALDAALPVEVSGKPGIGRTALLRHLAHHPRAAAFVDGIIYLSARHQSSADLLQLIFEAFYESEEICKPTDAEIRRGLQEKQALILLDDVGLAQNELERVLDIAPRSTFVVTTRERCLWGEVRSVVLGGLPGDDAVALLEREIERPLDATERSAAAQICTALEGHPLRILQAAVLIRDLRAPSGPGEERLFDGWSSDSGPARVIDHLLKSIDEKQKRALLALTALPGVPLHAQQISSIAEVTDVEPSLATLVRRGLVIRGASRYHLVDGVADRLRRTEDLKPWMNRAITYFTWWVERNRRNANSLLEESEVLWRAQQYAADARRWGEVVRVAQFLEGALVLGARWGAWAIVLEHGLAAAKAAGDRSAEAWALHQIGTRALCLGESNVARSSLGQAVALREALHEDAAAAASRRNLHFVLAPMADASREPRPTTIVPPTPIESVRTLGSLPLRDAAIPAMRARKPHSPGTLLFTGLLSVIIGWFGYWAIATGIPFQTSRAPLQEPPHAVPAPLPAAAPSVSDPPPLAAAPPAAGTDTANILVFTARPGAVAAAERTELCYAVSSAFQVRIEPGVGEVVPSSTLSCRRVAPVRTTTFELTAYGLNGQHVSRQLVVVVK